ncbi:MAG: tetratricopeptide (TPR) repeat protein [Alteromonadaceae bacterium]|jgi:tetratricopeptide (TPR) repeat protein
MIQQANQYFQRGQFQQAEHLYRVLLTKNKNDVDALLGLGQVAMALNSYQQAYDIFVRCLSLNTKQIQIYLLLAQAAKFLTRFDKAEQALLAAYQLNKQFIPSLLALAIYYSEAGKYDLSENYLKTVVEEEPEHIQAFSLFVKMDKVSLYDASLGDYINRMLAKLKSVNDDLSKQDKIMLHYSFAELHHKEEQYAQAFTHFEQANKLQYEGVDFRVSDMEGYFNDLIETFNKEIFTGTISNPINTEDNQALTPIFIVGQPRSGSTLLEQMLMGHNKITSGGELPFMAGSVAQGLLQLTGKNFPKACELLDKKKQQILADHYLKNLQNLSPNSHYIIDKMPANYQSIGLIKLLMPQAKIIYITRDPLDVSWSIFRNYFESLEPYFCSLKEIAQYHHCYKRVMLHWQCILPEFIHKVTYQDLINEPEKTLTTVLSFCGLEFQDECLNFSQQQRHIRTLSNVQLRDGIKQKGQSSWRAYREHLQSLLDDLGIT